MAMPFFYLLSEEDNRTGWLAREQPRWGRPLQGMPLEGSFHMSDWHDLAHVVLYRLAHHRARTADRESATCCIIASPMGSRHPSAEERRLCRAGAAARLTEVGSRHCPGKPLVVIGGPDSDGSGTALCAGLWQRGRCAKGLADSIVRVTGNAPGLQSEIAGHGSRGLCRRLVVPYLSHARSAAATAQRSSQMGSAGRRSLRIAYAAASWGHVDADAHGFVAWRKALRNACKSMPSSQCTWVWISMSGNGAEKALQHYARADFCLQPPGDTLPRPGIIDALSVGCVPVLFHPGQAKLWPDHWTAANASSVTFDWTDGAPRPRERDHRLYTSRARQALETLIALPYPELQRLQRGIVDAASRLIYRKPRFPTNIRLPNDGGPSSDTGKSSEPLVTELEATEVDAVDVLVARMRTLRLAAQSDEAAAYQRDIATRQAMIEAQRAYETRRVRERPLRPRRDKR